MALGSESSQHLPLLADEAAADQESASAGEQELPTKGRAAQARTSGRRFWEGALGKGRRAGRRLRLPAQLPRGAAKPLRHDACDYRIAAFPEGAASKPLSRTQHRPAHCPPARPSCLHSSRCPRPPST